MGCCIKEEEMENKEKEKRKDYLLAANREREERGREFWATGSLLTTASMEEDAEKERSMRELLQNRKHREKERWETKRVS
jgi:hypothetical protein